MSKRILITGGSGLVGSVLTGLLLERGYEVAHLSRKARRRDDGVVVYRWDLKEGFVDEKAIAWADAIVHLAGAGVADRRWTDARKKEIVDSRVDSAKLLEKALRDSDHTVKTFVSASGIGYYGDKGDDLMVETDGAADDFLAETCVVWEGASEGIERLGLRRVILRIGIVLSLDGGALPKMALPVKMGVGSYFGDGQQYYAWIHILDLCRLFLYALEREDLQGVYNAVAPENVRNRDFVKVLAKVLGRPFIPVPAPKFVLKMALGQMSNALLFSVRVSAEKVVTEGFVFDFPSLDMALSDLYG